MVYMYDNLSAFDSQSTLVDIAPFELTFDRDSVNDAIISSPFGPLYTVSTKPHLGVTDIYACSAPGARRLVARFEVRMFLPDVVRFPAKFGEKSVRIKSWLKSVKGKEREMMHHEGKNLVASMECLDGRCTWSSDEQTHLGLFAVGEPYSPIAYLRYASPSSPLALEIDQRALSVLDEIVVSTIILEQRQRFEARIDKVSYKFAY